MIRIQALVHSLSPSPSLWKLAKKEELWFGLNLLLSRHIRNAQLTPSGLHPWKLSSKNVHTCFPSSPQAPEWANSCISRFTKAWQFMTAFAQSFIYQWQLSSSVSVDHSLDLRNSECKPSSTGSWACVLEKSRMHTFPVLILCQRHRQRLKLVFSALCQLCSSTLHPFT